MEAGLGRCHLLFRCQQYLGAAKGQLGLGQVNSALCFFPVNYPNYLKGKAAAV